jgi:hypothetical protein
MRNFFLLLRFNLKTLPRAVPGVFLLNIAMAVFFKYIPYNSSSFEMALGSGVLQIANFSFVLGLLFYSQGGTFPPIAHEEFLFARPVPRWSAWLARTCLFFVLIFAGPVFNFCNALRHPDRSISLTQPVTSQPPAYQPPAAVIPPKLVEPRIPDLNFSLRQGVRQPTPTPEKLTVQLPPAPDNPVVHYARASRPTVDIQRGWLFLAGWQLLAIVPVALGMQIMTFVSTKIRLTIGIFYLAFIVALIPHWTGIAIEPVFYQFMWHWRLVAITAIAVFACVQWFAYKRVEEMEII